jgi:hypothetical protein
MTKTHFIIDVPLMALMLLQGISEIVLLVGSNDSTYIGIGGYEWKYIRLCRNATFAYILT